MQMSLIVIGSVLSSTLLTTLVTKWFDRRKTASESGRNDAEATDLLSQAWERSMRNLTAQMDHHQQRIYDLEKKLEEAYRTIADLRTLISQLESQIAKRRKEDNAD